MINLLKQSRALLTIPILSEPVKTSTLAIEEPGEEYVRLSKALGINKIPLRLVELARVVQEECLGTHPYEAVVRYLDRRVEELRKKRPRSHYYYTEWSWHPVKQYSSHHSLSNPRFDYWVYDKPIPYPVMLTISKIQQRINDAEFYVTDIREYRDPFLGVTVTGSDTLFVIERWDEPKFR
jgi:hypothetical protein